MAKVHLNAGKAECFSASAQSIGCFDRLRHRQCSINIAENA